MKNGCLGDLPVARRSFELVKDISCWVEMGSDRGTENVIVFLPGWTCFVFFLQLLDTVLFESLYDKGGRESYDVPFSVFGSASMNPFLTVYWELE